MPFIIKSGGEKRFYHFRKKGRGYLKTNSWECAHWRIEESDVNCYRFKNGKSHFLTFYIRLSYQIFSILNKGQGQTGKGYFTLWEPCASLQEFKISSLYHFSLIKLFQWVAFRTSWKFAIYWPFNCPTTILHFQNVSMFTFTSELHLLIYKCFQTFNILKIYIA